MKKKSKITVLVGLCLVMILLNAYTYSSEALSAAEMFWRGVGRSAISVPLWIVLGGFVLFGGIVWILNLFRKNEKLIFSLLDKSNAGLIVGIVLKIFFADVP